MLRLGKKGGILQTLVSGNVPASRKLMKRFFGPDADAIVGEGALKGEKAWRSTALSES